MFQNVQLLKTQNSRFFIEVCKNSWPFRNKLFFLNSNWSFNPIYTCFLKPNIEEKRNAIILIVIMGFAKEKSADFKENFLWI